MRSTSSNGCYRSRFRFFTLLRAVLLIYALSKGGAGIAQYLGGRYSFAFLRLPTHAPLASMGGIAISQRDRNVSFFLSNPALLHTDTDKMIALHYSPYYASIAHSSVAYGDSYKENGHWGTAIQYLDYGTMEETDATGAVLGDFSVREYAAILGYAHTLSPYTIGVNVKLAGSHIANYSSYAALLDIGGLFKHPTADWTIGLLIKNVGFGLKPYTPDTPISLPFDVQVGTSFKPKFMPLRFTATVHHLHRFNITYDDPVLQKTIDQNGNEVTRRKTFADKLARHFSIGMELSLGKALKVMGGYNHLVRQEQQLEARPLGAGFSLGALLQIKAFSLSYGRFYQHSAGGISYLTLTGNLNELGGKKVSYSN